MIIDAFLWNGETDMGNLRVATLKGHVDVMVAVSCNLTHQGDPSTLTPPPDGCEWLVVDAEPIPGGGRGGYGTPYWAWVEKQHRNGMAQAAEGWPADTVVLISDMDEIPDPRTLDAIEAEAQHGPCSVVMRMHGFALDYLHPMQWCGTTASRADTLAPQSHRSWRHKLPHVGHGWHLSWFGDMDEKRRKLRSFSHAELSEVDVEDCYRAGIHTNGEHMSHLSPEDIAGLDWPAPLFDGFDIPASWWSPR